MLCIGVGGMDVATAMTGVPMRLKMPQIIKVNLKGHLKPGCNAKEIILEMLRRVGIKGGLGKVFEYVGEGAAGLEGAERATITNMGAEMGAAAVRCICSASSSVSTPPMDRPATLTYLH